MWFHGKCFIYYLILCFTNPDYDSHDAWPIYWPVAVLLSFIIGEVDKLIFKHRI